MSSMKLPKLHLGLVMALLAMIYCAESLVYVHFDHVPPKRSRFSTAIFRYSIINNHGQKLCKGFGCSFYCELDGHPLKSCSSDRIVFKNLTVNHGHKFLLNVSTSSGEKNSSSYYWYIDTIPPTAMITSETTYTNAANISIRIKFSEACTGRGGFKCTNASSCDIKINGPANIDPSTLQTVKPGNEYNLVVRLSPSETFGRIAIKMGESFCTDEAGNLFARSNDSILILHLDRRLVHADLRTLIPTYELEIEKGPRTVVATNKMNKLKFYVVFSAPLANSTEDVLNSLDVNSGYFVPISTVGHANRKFVFELKDLSRTDIVTVKLQSDTLISKSGNAVSPVTPVVFLYDATRPSIMLSTSSPGVTKEANFDVIVEFTKPVFNFDASCIEIGGGTVARFKQLSKALYLVTIEAVSQNVVTVFVPEGKVNDVAGNPNLPSMQLEVRHYLVPAISVALHSFVTASLLATSLAAGVLALSSASLAAIDGVTSGSTNAFITDPSRNLLGMAGHLQVFALSDWYSTNLPAEYSEVMKSLRWLIPREKLPWNKETSLIWPNYSSFVTSDYVLEKNRREYLGKEERRLSYVQSPKYIFSSRLPGIRQSNDATERTRFVKYGNLGKIDQMQTDIGSEFEVLSEQQNSNIASVASVPPLSSKEYFIYFLRGEPLSAANVVKKLENYEGWQDLEMNLFWLGVAVVGLIVMHFLALLFLRWRTGNSVHGLLSVPRFELFLLILMLPCIGQSAAFIIRGNTNAGIAVGALLLAVPAAFILSTFLFLVITVFMGNFFQYRELRTLDTNHSYCTKLSEFFFSGDTIGRWIPIEGMSSSLLLRSGILFENRKGPPKFISVDGNDLSTITKSTNSGRRGIGRMRALSLDSCNEEATYLERLLGCTRSAYIIFDLLRRVGLGILAGAYSSPSESQCTIALTITAVQFLYLFIIKPYIRGGVYLVESVSLLCEAVLFGLLFCSNRENRYKDQRIIGIVMLVLLFLSFVPQLLNEWYSLMKCILRHPQAQKPSFKAGLILVGKGLFLPLVPRKYWSRFMPDSSRPTTGLVPVVPPDPEIELENRNSKADQALFHPRRNDELKRSQGLKSDSKNEIKKLQELARASFSGKLRKSQEGSCSYAPREQSRLGETSINDSAPSSAGNKN
ncbi:hypothetical protein J5N97_007210 [Dioscorea zingiberensis]|uniref:Bacterial Ig-like domain-containing protein n=1 Tax=Dioscorea zingiberensis TaxID=325984 RepID=A0A9D5DCS1_9LILI|nr:hypothetical protein J5N97_007210 [Dioscorea zingiberensis]